MTSALGGLICQHHVKGGLRTWGAPTITSTTKIDNGTAPGAFRTIVLLSGPGALAEDDLLLVTDDRLEDAFFKDVPEPVAVASPTMGGELHKFNKRVSRSARQHWLSATVTLFGTK